jgi:hypothetical protein
MSSHFAEVNETVTEGWRGINGVTGEVVLISFAGFYLSRHDVIHKLVQSLRQAALLT